MLHYVRQGSGKTIVLVHGFLGGSEQFMAMMDDLSLHFDVIAVDLPGHGQSNMDINAYTVDEYAKAIIEVLQHEGVEKAAWLGHSMGGYITLAAMSNQLFPIPKAILLHSAVNADDDATKEKRTKQQQEIKRNGVEAFVEQVLPNFIAPQSSPRILDKAKAIAKEATIEGLVAALEVMKARPPRQSFINDTDTPLLIIEGNADKIVPKIETNNQNVTKVILESGHLGMLEDLDGVLHAIYSFLK